jgi:hypothetical protein
VVDDLADRPAAVAVRGVELALVEAADRLLDEPGQLQEPGDDGVVQG